MKIEASFCAKIVTVLAIAASGVGCSKSSPTDAYVGSWQLESMVFKGEIQPSPANTIWMFNADNTGSLIGQQCRWQEENGKFIVTTPRITYNYTPSFSENGTKLVLTPPADFAGGQIGPTTLKKID